MSSSKHKIKNRVTISKGRNGWSVCHMTFDNGNTVWHNVINGFSRAEAIAKRRELLDL